MAGSSSDQDATTPLSYFKYDVFLSFRGSTRPNITDVLYHALIDERIETFKDDRELRPTKELEASLVEAIERSRMSILILCDGYPSSHWCLDELVKIMECSDNGRKRPVLPVYFYVAKSDVQFQKNAYETAMAAHEEKGRYTHKLEAWKLALCEVGKIYGQRIGEKTWWRAAIDNIVEEVTRMLPPLPLYIDRPLGLDSELEKVQRRLKLGSHDTCFMLGIHGDGDVISKFVAELYNMIRPHFVDASFLSNIRDKTTANGGGLEHLQKTLLSEMRAEVKGKIGSGYRGSSEIKGRLGHKRVLLVLDDVDSIEQLNSLAGGTDWFGPGSRIIITTRYEDVLDDHVSKNGVVVKKYNITEASSSTVKEENVVGLEKEFNEVIKQLKGEEGSPGNVVSIVGMGGLGKTTLARKVYNSNEARELFPCRAWATISQKPMIEVFKELLKCLKVPKSEYEKLISDEGKLKEKVRNCLNRNKYLVVLDDVWDTNNPWGDLRSCFPRNKNGSMILVTTRDDRVANVWESKNPHLTVSFMNEEESWELFHKEVFYSTVCPLELEPIGRSIAKSCSGLPLLIKNTAGIVAKKKKLKDQWEEVKKRLRPYRSLAKDKDGKKMMERLKLSYDDLQDEHKPCFLYLGAFSEDEEILVNDLIRMWIAEEFIMPEIEGGGSEIEPEDIGEDCLNELVDRNLVQVASRRSDGKGVKTVKIHDLIRDMCRYVSEKPDNDLDNKAFSLSFPKNLGSYACLVTPRDQASTSLFVYGDITRWSDLIPYDSQVNVLYLNGVVANRTVLDIDEKYLNKLKSIKFLKIWIYDAPFALFELQSFQTLYVLHGHYNEKICIDEGLKQLRHVRSDVGVKFSVNNAEWAVKDKMQNVQTLSYVYPDSEIGYLLDNGYFANLRTLGLVINEDVLQSAEENLRSLDQLSKLLKLKLKFGSLDSWGKIAFPANLSKITLKFSMGLKQEDMNALGRISSLKILKLYDVYCIRRILHCGSAGSFPQLQVFIVIFGNVTRVILKRRAMPKLRRAVFRKCLGLKLWRLPERMLCLGSNLHFVEAADFDEEERRRRMRRMRRMTPTTKRRMMMMMMMTTRMRRKRIRI